MKESFWIWRQEFCSTQTFPLSTNWNFDSPRCSQETRLRSRNAGDFGRPIWPKLIWRGGSGEALYHQHSQKNDETADSFLARADVAWTELEMKQVKLQVNAYVALHYLTLPYITLHNVTQRNIHTITRIHTNIQTYILTYLLTCLLICLLPYLLPDLITH